MHLVTYVDSTPLLCNSGLIEEFQTSWMKRPYRKVCGHVLTTVMRIQLCNQLSIHSVGVSSARFRQLWANRHQKGHASDNSTLCNLCVQATETRRTGSQKQFEKHLLQLVSEQLSRKFKRILEKNLRVLQKFCTVLQARRRCTSSFLGLFPATFRSRSYDLIG